MQVLDQTWEAGALCGQADPGLFFPSTPTMERRAKALCGRCAVREECLASALAGRVEFGVWGGLNERERRSVLRRNPGRRDWSAFAVGEPPRF